MKIAVLGASVSAQVSSDGEITGYVEFFRREILEKSREVEVKQFCYPGNRLSDAGIVMVSQIVDYMPDVCIVEPIVEDISRGVNSSNFDILYVYDKLINAGILPITLILPWPENNKELPAYRIIKEIHHKYPIRLIEFDLPDGFSRDDYFSGPHTKKAGGVFYASQITKEISSLFDVGLEISSLKKSWVIHEELLFVSHCKASFDAKISQMKLNFKTSSFGEVKFRVIQKQIIGPFSPKFQTSILDIDGNLFGDIVWRSAWDPYCHYSRDSFVLLASGTVPLSSFSILIEKNNKHPDYDLCRRSNIEWPNINELHFKPISDLIIISDKELVTEFCQ